jgi:transposase
MAKRYRPVPRDQPFLLPPDMREWLPADHPVWLVITVVEQHLDTRAVHATRRTGGAGAAGYDPDMLTALLVWAYASRVTSSRRIEALCRTDVAFKVICAGQVPDHVTIARFRAGLGTAAAALFDQVLMLCARLGMGQLGLVALDGMKVAASASKSANRGREKLRELAGQIAAEHAATDAAEDALFGPGVRGDEVPAELADPRTRHERIAAALAELDAEQRAAEAAQQARQARAAAYRTGPGGTAGKPPAEVRVRAALARVERAAAGQQARADDWQARQAASIAAGTGRLPGTVPAPPERSGAVARARATLAKAQAAAAAAAAASPPPGPGPVRNITDPHSRLMPVRGGGFIQGYNTQNLASSDGLIIATRLTADPTDTPWFQPMLAAGLAAADLITAARPARDDADDTSTGIGLILADAGYLSEDNLLLAGPDRLIATGKRRDLEKHAAGDDASRWQSPVITAMEKRLATPAAITAYRQRGHIAETPHASIKHNKGFRQFSVRGKPRVTAEWLLTCTVHNLFKAITSGTLTPAALATLPAQPA